MYFPDLDVVLAILYLYLLWKEGQYAQQILPNKSQQALIALLWQLPGFILAGLVLLSLDSFAYYISMLVLWDTPAVPLVSLLPGWNMMGRPLYYYSLSLLVPLLAFLYFLPALNPQK